MIKPNSFKVHLEDATFDTSSLIFLSASPLYEYKDGKKTENVIGTTATIGATSICDQFNVKIDGISSDVLNEAIKDVNGQKKIILHGCKGTIYTTSEGNAAISFRAEGLEFADKALQKKYEELMKATSDQDLGVFEEDGQ